MLLADEVGGVGGGGGEQVDDRGEEAGDEKKGEVGGGGQEALHGVSDRVNEIGCGGTEVSMPTVL